MLQATLHISQAAHPGLLVSPTELLNLTPDGLDRVLTIETKTTLTGWEFSAELPTWITATKTTGSTGDDSTTLTIADIGSDVDRAVTLTLQTIADPDVFVDVEVGQLGRIVDLMYSVNGTTTSPEARSDGLIVNTVGPAEDWEVSGSVPSWITIADTTGNGHTITTIALSENTVVETRTAEITFRLANYITKTDSITITQGPAAAVLSISTDTLTFAATGEQKTLYITSNLPWSLEYSGEGFSVVPTSGDAGEAIAIVVTAAANSDNSRTGGIAITTIGGVAAGVSEDTAACTLSQAVADDTITLGSLTSNSIPGGGTSSSIGVTVLPTGSHWTVSSDQSWCTVSASSGDGNGSIAYTTTENTGSQRTATLTFTRGTDTETHTVTQAAYTGAITEASLSFAGAGESKTLSIVANYGWTATVTGTGFSITGATNGVLTGTGDTTITVVAAANTGSSRTGSVALTTAGTASDSADLSQSAGSSASVLWNSSGTDTVSGTIAGEIPVGSISSTGLSGSWSLSVSDAWMEPASTSGTGNLDAVQVNTYTNEGPARRGTVTVTSGGVDYLLYINQAGAVVPTVGTINMPDLTYVIPPNDPINLTPGRAEIFENGDIKYMYRNMMANVYVYYLNGVWYNTNDDTPSSATIAGGTPSGSPTSQLVCSDLYGTLRMSMYWPADDYSGPYFSYVDTNANTYQYDQGSTTWVGTPPGTLTEGACPS
jgi:hypothetical protein